MGSIPLDHPYRRELARLERQAGDDITAALNQLRRDLFRDIGRGNVAEILMRLRDRDINERLRQALYNALLPTVELGAEMGRGYIEAEILGVKRVTISDPSFNWELINEAARAWLRKYTFDLISGIEQTNITRLQPMIDDFIAASDMTINQLSEQVAGIFGPVRGEMIAVTEVTRAFAQSNVEAWRAAEVVQRKRWNTAVDELVCPICAPLNGKEVGIDESFGGFYDGPPAHPRCRCWVTPVVELPQ